MKNIKKFISYLIVTVLLLFNLNVSAAFITPGDTEHLTENISINSNQPLEYEFYLPFDSGSATLTYSADENTSLSIETGQQSVSAQLTAGSGSAELTFPQVERKGERKYTFTSAKNVNLSVKFIKYTDELVTVPGGNVSICNLGENGEAIEAAVIIDRNASAIVVRGAHRYINNEDAKECPTVIDGSIYLPARVLALAFGCYYENIPEKNFMFIRESESGKEFYFKKDDCYTLTNFGEKLPISFKPVYKNSEPYLPVRFLAEALGKTVGYKNGIVVIDDKYSVENILNTTEVFKYVETLFDNFKPIESEQKEYHVSKIGNDANPGTAEKPFQTLAKAGAVAKAGDTVIIHEGVYRETLKPLNSGTATNPIIFRAADKEKVVISATEQIKGFKASSENSAWVEATVPLNLGDGRNQVFCNDECIVEARYPNNTEENSIYADGKRLSDLFPARGDFKVDMTDKTIVTSETLLNQSEADYWKGATFVSMHGYGWTLCTAKIASSEKGKLTMDADSFAAKWWYDADENHIWNYGYITGHKNAIDSPGEWVMDGNKLIMMPLENVSASDMTVEVKQRQLTIDLTDRQYIQIKDIECFGGSAAMKDSEMCVLNGVDMKYISHYTLSDDQREGYIDDGSNDARINRGEQGAPALGEVGIYVGGKNNAIINSFIDHSAAAGIYIGGLYAYIDNNEIKNTGYMSSYVSGIFACSEPWGNTTDPRGGFSIYNNSIYNAGRGLITILGSEFSVGNTWTYNGRYTSHLPFVPYEVAYNDLHDGVLMSMDTGPYYSYMVSCATDKVKSRVHNNYLYSTSNEEHPYSFGFYNDGGAIGVDYYNNVVFTTRNTGAFSYEYLSVSKTKTTSTCSANSAIEKPVSGGASALSAEQFPFGKPFYGGVLNSEAAFMKNYEKQSDAQVFYSVEAATLDGAESDNFGGAVMDSSEDVITFNNVDFGNGKNRINIYFTADKYCSNDIFTVYAGSSIDTAKKCEVLISSKSDTLKTLDFVSADIGDITGKTNVYIKLRKASTSTLTPSVHGIMLSNDGKYNGIHNASELKAADYNIAYSLTSVNQAAQIASNGSGRYVMNTSNGTVLVYKNVNFNEVPKKIAMTYKGYSDNYPKITFHLNSPNATAFATYNGRKTDGKETDTFSVSRNITPGTYDLYVKFSNGGTTDLYSFNFKAE